MRSNILIVLLLFSLSAFGQANWDMLTVVGNSIGTQVLAKNQVSSIFKGNRSRWSNDENVILVMPSSKHPGAEVMAATIYGRDMNYVKKYWLNLVFQGRSNAPLFFDTNEEILNYVKKHPGAIGILINASETTTLNIKVT